MNRVKTVYCFAFLTIASLFWGFSRLFLIDAPNVFSHAKEDMSYAWYVPLFSLYVLWRERNEIVKSLSSPSIAGALSSLPFLAMGFLGVRGLQIRFEIVAVVGLFITLPWAFFGFNTAKKMLFPAGFLLFCLPLSTFLDIITIHLRLFATSVAYGALQGFGAEIIKRGTMLMASDGSFSIDIAEPCSGLRSLFALMALTVAYAYFTQPTWPRRIILSALSVPIAVAGNVMRIFTICLVGKYASSEFATGFYHDYSGFVIFFVAIMLMVACGEAISVVSRRCRAKEKTLPREDSRRTDKAPITNADLGVALCVTLAVTVSMAFLAATPKATLTEAPSIRLVDIEGYNCRKLPPAEAEVKGLPEDTIIDKRIYQESDGSWHLVTMVIGGISKGSIHRPELCLSGQGFLMATPRNVEVNGIRWRFITLRNANGADDQGFAYTFFNQAGFYTPSHTGRIFRDVLDRSLFNRIDRWVMVTVNSSSDNFSARKIFFEKLSEKLK